MVSYIGTYFIHIHVVDLGEYQTTLPSITWSEINNCYAHIPERTGIFNPNSSKPENGCYFGDDDFKCISWNEKSCINSLRLGDAYMHQKTIIDTHNGLSHGQHQGIFWTDAGILLIGPLRTNFFCEMLIEIIYFHPRNKSIRKYRLEKGGHFVWILMCYTFEYYANINLFLWTQSAIR